tara:strand:- start:86 stop:304 length:219 start_codon:yes stop_codon:yes gene_type:complete
MSRQLHLLHLHLHLHLKVPLVLVRELLVLVDFFHHCYLEEDLREEYFHFHHNLESVRHHLLILQDFLLHKKG